ncbi:hypothetical protein [uncultured Mediterranean phage uvMED]|nr:hypothetical protein [uncultured Mediterranean phage uvMED]
MATRRLDDLNYLIQDGKEVQMTPQQFDDNTNIIVNQFGYLAEQVEILGDGTVLFIDPNIQLSGVDDKLTLNIDLSSSTKKFFISDASEIILSTILTNASFQFALTSNNGNVANAKLFVSGEEKNFIFGNLNDIEEHEDVRIDILPSGEARVQRNKFGA